MVYSYTSYPQKVFTGLRWQSSNHGLQAAGQTTSGGGSEIACAFPITVLSSRQILPLVKSDLQALGCVSLGELSGSLVLYLANIPKFSRKGRKS